MQNPEDSPKQLSPIAIAALELARRGWRLFPASPLDNRPLVEGGSSAASSDSSEILAWGRRWPEANFALATGSDSGVLAITIQRTKKCEGFANLHYLEEQFGSLPPTASIYVPSGGEVLLFAYPQGASPLRLGALQLPEADGNFTPYAGIVFRRDLSAVVIPPSTIKDGPYGWGNSLLKIGVAEVPAWVLGILLAQPRPGSSDLAGPYVAASRPPEIASPIERRCQDFTVESALNRKPNFLQLAVKFGQAIATGAISENAAERTLVLLAADCGLISSVGLAKVMNDIWRGLAAGIRNPARVI